MLILSVESSCDETAVALVRDGREVLTDCIASQVPLHRLYGGVVPEIASRKHIEAIYGLAEQALANANVTRDEIDAIAVTYAPGLIGALLVGVNFAKAAALSLGVPLVPVHHIRGHIAANYLAYPDLEPPFLCLVVSGGHTMLVDVQDYTKMEILGGTRDDAAGECFDKVARMLNMPYPGGAALDKLAYKGDPRAVKLPSPALHDGLDFSFSGLKTAALNYINSERQKGAEPSAADIAASYTAVITDAITSKVGKAMEMTGASHIVLAGGVAANSHLRKKLSELCQKKNAVLTVPPISLCGDNAAMVACAGYFEYLKGNFSGTGLNASATEPQ